MADSSTRVIDSQFGSIMSDTTRTLFSASLRSNPAHKSYNMFSEMGLVGNAEPGRDFDSAIGKFLTRNAGKLTYYIRHPKRGAPQVGDRTVLRDNADTRERPSQSIVSVDMNIPGELIGTNYANAISHAPIYQDLALTMSEYIDHQEYEQIITYMSGGRGDNDGYEIFEQVQAGIGIDTLPEEWRDLHAANPITRPTRLLQSWDTLENWNANTPYLDSTDISYTGASKIVGSTEASDATFDFFQDLSTYLRTRSRARDGYGIMPAMLKMDSEMYEKKAMEKQKGAFVLLVSEEIGNQLQKSQNWRTYQADLATSLGLKQGIATSFIGKISNIHVATSDLMTRFTEGGNRFTRGLLFGQQSLAVTYYMYNVPMTYMVRNHNNVKRSMNLMMPYRCWINPLNKGKQHELIGEYNFGIRAVRYPQRGQLDVAAASKRYVDRGRVCCDFLEGAPTTTARSDRA